MNEGEGHGTINTVNRRYVYIISSCILISKYQRILHTKEEITVIYESATLYIKKQLCEEEGRNEYG